MAAQIGIFPLIFLLLTFCGFGHAASATAPEAPADEGDLAAVAAKVGALANPALSLATPGPGQSFRVGERVTVSWTFSGISDRKKLSVTLKTSNGKLIRRKFIRARKTYSFKAKPGHVSKLALITVCIPKSTHKAKVCDSRSISVSAENPPGIVSPVDLTFNNRALGFSTLVDINPAAQSVQLAVSGKAAASFSIADSANWLTVSPKTGTAPATVKLAVNAKGLAAGSYKATVTAKGPGEARTSLPVTLEVREQSTGAPPSLKFSAASLSFATPRGGTPSPEVVDLFSSDGGAVAFAVTDNAPWLTLSPGGTTSPSRITLAANGSGLLPGAYTAAVTATAAGYAAVSLPVTLTVSPPGTATLLSDDFADDNANGWTTVNDVARVVTDWRVSNKAYRQFNLVGLDTRAHVQGHNTGTFAYRTDSLDLQDYQFDVTAFPYSETGLDIGVMFRFRDPENYYRLSIAGANGFTRLERKLAGNFTTLAGNGRGFVRGVAQHISVTVKGSVLQVSVNGERLFSVRDDSLPTGGIALYCRDNCTFDDIDVRTVPAWPSVAVSLPEARTLTPQTTFDVSAVVLNKPTGSVEVDFNLTRFGDACSHAVEMQPGLYEAQCTLPADGRTSSLVANLRQGSTIVDADASEQIAVGNQFIAIGDSISFGLGDTDESDNQDAQGWVISAGYSSVLTDLRNREGGKPSMVYNNAIPGASTEHIIQHLDYILARHGQAQNVLLLIGTNDAGRGIPVATYKSNMLNIIGRIRARGKTPIVGLVPSRFDDSTGAMNALIASYNNVVSGQLGLSPHEIGPDFYSYFLNLGATERASLFLDDNLHPNAAGYRAMAELWRQSLDWVN